MSNWDEGFSKVDICLTYGLGWNQRLLFVKSLRYVGLGEQGTAGLPQGGVLILMKNRSRCWLLFYHVNLVLLFLRFMVGDIPCPSYQETKGNNSFPILRTPERNQYENSGKWYLNISWNSLPGKSSCHRIFMEVLTMSMAKILYPWTTCTTILTAVVMKTFTTKTHSKYLKSETVPQ